MVLPEKVKRHASDNEAGPAASKRTKKDSLTKTSAEVSPETYINPTARKLFGTVQVN